MNKIENGNTVFHSVVERLAEICKIVWVVGGIAVVSFVCPPIGVVLLVGVLWKQVKPTPQSSDKHGSARFATVRDLLNAGCLFQHVGVFLGRAVGTTAFSLWFRMRVLFGLPVKRSATAMQVVSTAWKKPKSLIVRVPDQMPHTAIFGASGSGKSSCFAMPMLLGNGAQHSLVVLDPKGELARQSARHRESVFGHQIVVIDPFGVADCGYEPQRFNPLDCFRHDESKVIDESRRLANALVVTTGKETDKFWSDSSISVVTAILAFLMTEAKEGASLNHLRDITSDPNMVEKVLKMMLQSDKAYGMLRRLAGEVSGLEGKTRASVFSVTNSNLSFLDSVAVANTLGESTFDPNVLIHDKATVYLCLPVDRLQEMASLQRVILSTLINLIFAAGEDSERRVHFLLDEAASLGAMPALYNSVQFGRSYGIRSTYLFQSSSQVERCFPESQRSDFMSTVSKVYAGSDDLETAKSVSEMMGNTTIFSATEQSGVNDGHTGSTGIHDQTSSKNWGSSNSVSYAEQSRSLMTPAEVLTLPRHLAIALLPGLPPVLIEKMPYYKKTGRGFLRRTVSLFGDMAFVTLTLVFWATILWALTLGRHEPIVVEFFEASRTNWR